MNEKQNKTSLFRKISSFAVSFVFLFLILGIVIYHKEARDYILNLNYSPTSEVASLADKLKLTDYGRNIFYATRPQIENASEFNQNCTNNLEKTAILGCYKSDKIYIYNIDNPDLDGIKEVTAAHEILHAVWARLGVTERDRLKKQLNNEYENLKTPDLENTMASYAITEPGEHENELHSILGTEFAGISKDLDKHYSKFFKDRQVILNLFEKYNDKFKQLKNRGDEISSQMENLKKQIDSESNAYESSLISLDEDIINFNMRAKSGSYLSEAEFSQDRNSLNQRVSELEYWREHINSRVNQYNELRLELQDVAIEADKLNDSINSNLSVPNSL